MASVFSRIFYRCVDWNILVWIGNCIGMKSHLLQMRGLKPWLNKLLFNMMQSHLLQMRGLKPNRPTSLNTKKSRIFYRCVDWNCLYPCSERWDFSRIFYRCVDWNLLLWTIYQEAKVASFTDAWIETEEMRHQYRNPKVASFTDAWIETQNYQY